MLKCRSEETVLWLGSVAEVDSAEKLCGRGGLREFTRFSTNVSPLPLWSTAPMFVPLLLALPVIMSFNQLAFNPPPSLVSALNSKASSRAVVSTVGASAKIGHIFAHFARLAYLTQLAVAF